MSAQFPGAVTGARITDGTITDADLSDSAAVAPHKLADPRAYATVEELFFVSNSFSLTAGLGATLEVVIGVIPIFGRVDSIMFCPTVAAPSNTGSNGWKFRPRRKRLSISGASSTRAVTSVDMGNTTYSRAWLALEGVSLDNPAWTVAYAAGVAAFFAPRDVMTISVEAVGTPVENCAGMFTVRVVPL